MVEPNLFDICTRRVVQLESGESVAQAAERMREANVGCLLVIEDDQVAGIVTDRDIVVRVLAEHRDPDDTPIGAIASRDVVMLPSDASVERALEVIREHGVRRIPIVDQVDGRQVVGIVSISDLASAAISERAVAKAAQRTNNQPARDRS